jgi:hypothetical protein
VLRRTASGNPGAVHQRCQHGSKTGDPVVHYWNGYVDTAVNHAFLNVFSTVARESQFVNAIVKLRERGVERKR